MFHRVLKSLNWILRTKHEPQIGIDISSACVKLLELSYSKGQFCVESFAILPFPPGVIDDKQIKDFDAAANVIFQTTCKSRSESRSAAVAIFDSSVMTKVIQMSADMSEDELEYQSLIEAERFVPYPLEEVNVDFDVLGPCQNSPEFVNVLVVASRSENVMMRVELLAKAGLDVHAVDVDSFATARASRLCISRLPNRGQNQTVAIFDIGAQITSFTVMHNGLIIFTREEIFGGNRLTLDIQRHYGLSYAEAGIAKKTGKLPEDYVTEVLNPFIETVVIQLRRSLQFFYSSSDKDSVQHILLCGGTVMLPGLPEAIQNSLGIPTTIANPFVGMQFAPTVNVQNIEKDGSSLMVACGLALREFESFIDEGTAS